MNTINALKPHVSLNVKDIKTSIEFYRKLFGIEPVRIRADYAKFDVGNPSLNLTLNESSYNKNGALSHLGIQVASTEDVLAVKSYWEETGLITRAEMRTNCCYALQDKTWVRDPDDNEWEVFVVLEDIPAESKSHKMSGTSDRKEEVSSACCASALVEMANK